jgi:hypothetical protein
MKLISMPRLLGDIAAYRERAHRLVRAIGAIEQRRLGLLYKQVPGEVIDQLEDEIDALRAQLVIVDVDLMNLVTRVRMLNETRRQKVDLDRAFRKMMPGQRTSAGGGEGGGLARGTGLASSCSGGSGHKVDGRRNAPESGLKNGRSPPVSINLDIQDIQDRC